MIEIKKPAKNQIFSQKFQYASNFEIKIFPMSDFELKFLKRPTIRNQNFPLCQILKSKPFEKSVFEDDFFNKKLDFRQKVTPKKSNFDSIFSVKTAKFSPIVLFLKNVIS